MKIYLFLPFLMIAGATMSGCGTNGNTTAVAPVAESNELEGNGESKVSHHDEILIDVRSQEEWDSGHLVNAVLIPHEVISDRIAEVTTDKSAKIVLYCQMGGRAGRAKETLEKLGYTNVENGGGIEDLKERYGQ